ncbi:hypothetical protein HPB50_018049 [Hyalomma asiaticum]|uniref:Uncharacterized protein n=1 Tax=Hyalomma asiaticum TaxID=266040 RepID=A0ACB7S172_HYAAI|nr:hypothetical protein HPB50_018049 [Hyalomma asiaticum]
MDAARHSPYAAAFQEGFYATPPYFYGEDHRQPEMAWNEQTRWLPVGQLYSQLQQPSPDPVVAVPQTCAVAPSGAQCHDSVDNRLCRPRDQDPVGVQAPLSSIGTLKGPSGSSSASFSFWSPHSTPDDTSSSTSSANSLQTAATSYAVSDAQLITSSERQRRCKSADGVAPFPWATCIPMVGMTLVAALLFLFVIAIAVRSQRVMLHLPVTLYVDEGVLQNSWSRAANVGDALVYPEGRTLDGLDTRISEVTFPDFSKGAAPRTRQTTRSQNKNRMSLRPTCGSVFYTFCERPPLEFHYHRAANACVSTSAGDSAYVCNRGGNRFASLDHCLDSCVAEGGPAKECFDRPLFTRCARQDSLSSWWHHNGQRCVPWPFPLGGCPANGSMVFRTKEECRKRCEDRQHGPRCLRPKVVACGRNHLKYPYFAYRDPKEERVRCLHSSMTMLRRHRCLAGANRFQSHGACVSSCRKRPPSLG